MMNYFKLYDEILHVCNVHVCNVYMYVMYMHVCLVFTNIRAYNALFNALFNINNNIKSR